jgi:uncharacterized protein (DUF885 family)
MKPPAGPARKGGYVIVNGLRPSHGSTLSKESPLTSRVGGLAGRIAFAPRSRSGRVPRHHSPLGFAAAVAAAGLGLLASSVGAQTAAAQAPAPQATPSRAKPATAWVERSNQNAQVVIQAMVRFNPEFASQLGIDGHDREIVDLKPDLVARQRKAGEEVLTELHKRLKGETDPAVKQDLEILVQAVEDNIEEAQAHLKYEMPYIDVTQTVFQGIRSLLDDQVSADRRPAALDRLKRYAGLEPGFEPVTKLAMDRTRERLGKPGLLGPIQAEVERNLENSQTYVAGLGKLFEKYKIAGYEDAYAQLQKQLGDYDTFVRQEILPKARTDFRQPPELYKLSLKSSGVDMPVEELVARAQVAFMEIRNEMQALAPLVAKEKGYTVTDYRDVMRELKKDQWAGETILPHYEARIKDLEEIIRREHLVTLPDRQMRIRLASEAESAAIPAPNMRPPRMLGNTGEMGEFVLPLRVPGKAGQGMQQFDDFTYDAASWTLTAHEGRPGHELQFASMIEKGVSTARALFAMNSTNVEGWGLYSESIALPYMPVDGQLCSLQHRLLRAARAFLDPGLQMGTVTQEEAFAVLKHDVVLSDPMANQEVQRYTFLAPGQAPSYFCGYSRLLELRAATERALGDRFDQQKFHDFLLAQGALPPRLLRKAVMEEFVPQEKGQVSKR